MIPSSESFSLSISLDLVLESVLYPSVLRRSLILPVLESLHIGYVEWEFDDPRLISL